MANPIQTLLARCRTGFTPVEKFIAFGAGVGYVLCPLDFDFIPAIGWIDDGYAIYLVWRVLSSPTISEAELGRQSASPTQERSARSDAELALKPDEEG